MMIEERKFEELLVKHASATLKGLKMGSLFSYCPVDDQEFRLMIHRLHKKLMEKGVHLQVVGRRSGACQVLVWRQAQVDAMMNHRKSRCFLCRLGYPVKEGGEACIEHLCERLSCQHTFPHELGLFLGYPLADVLSFIENKGRDYLLCGPWKVYHRPDKARETFACYRQCRQHCLACYHQGQTVWQLTCAA